MAGGLAGPGILVGIGAGIPVGVILGFAIGGVFPSVRNQKSADVDRGASELGIVDMYSANK
jgi:hypothetical protein